MRRLALRGSDKRAVTHIRMATAKDLRSRKLKKKKNRPLQNNLRPVRILFFSKQMMP
jgi:hypothetical protein